MVKVYLTKRKDPFLGAKRQGEDESVNFVKQLFVIHCLHIDHSII